MKLFAKGIIGVILQVAFVAAGLFLGAGTFYWQDGLILLVIFIIMGFVFVIISSICYPKSLESRLILPGKSQPITDRIVTVLFLIFVASLMIFIPLDIFHFQLFSSPIPPVKYFGMVMFVAGYIFCCVAIIQNENAISFVDDQYDRGHELSDTGLYSHVRHPLYTSAFILMIGIPLWLGSYSGLLFSLFSIVIIILRIFVEEKFLIKELSGYTEYMTKIKYRLVPYVW